MTAHTEAPAASTPWTTGVRTMFPLQEFPSVSQTPSGQLLG